MEVAVEEEHLASNPEDLEQRVEAMKRKPWWKWIKPRKVETVTEEEIAANLYDSLSDANELSLNSEDLEQQVEAMERKPWWKWIKPRRVEAVAEASDWDIDWEGLWHVDPDGLPKGGLRPTSEKARDDPWTPHDPRSAPPTSGRLSPRLPEVLPDPRLRPNPTAPVLRNAPIALPGILPETPRAPTILPVEPRQLEALHGAPMTDDRARATKMPHAIVSNSGSLDGLLANASPKAEDWDKTAKAAKPWWERIEDKVGSDWGVPRDDGWDTEVDGARKSRRRPAPHKGRKEPRLPHERRPPRYHSRERPSSPPAIEHASHEAPDPLASRHATPAVRMANEEAPLRLVLLAARRLAQELSDGGREEPGSQAGKAARRVAAAYGSFFANTSGLLPGGDAAPLVPMVLRLGDDGGYSWCLSAELRRVGDGALLLHFERGEINYATRGCPAGCELFESAPGDVGPRLRVFRCPQGSNPPATMGVDTNYSLDNIGRIDAVAVSSGASSDDSSDWECNEGWVGLQDLPAAVHFEEGLSALESPATVCRVRASEVLAGSGGQTWHLGGCDIRPTAVPCPAPHETLLRLLELGIADPELLAEADPEDLVQRLSAALPLLHEGCLGIPPKDGVEAAVLGGRLVAAQGRLAEALGNDRSLSSLDPPTVLCDGNCPEGAGCRLVSSAMPKW
eukprot:Polyplicarium_translucidae@DN1246_c0_g1_i2.p1